MASIDRCENCVYSQNVGIYPRLECHKGHPIADLKSDNVLPPARWPIVNIDLWCGEYERRIR